MGEVQDCITSLPYYEIIYQNLFAFSKTRVEKVNILNELFGLKLKEFDLDESGRPRNRILFDVF